MSSVQKALEVLDKLVANVCKTTSPEATSLLGQLLEVKAALVEVEGSQQLRVIGTRHVIDRQALRHMHDRPQILASACRSNIEETFRILSESADDYLSLSIVRDNYTVALESRLTLLPLHPIRKQERIDNLKAIADKDFR